VLWLVAVALTPVFLYGFFLAERERREAKRK
jgi:hypothetical protein